MLFSHKTPDSLLMPVINSIKTIRRTGIATPLMRKTYNYSCINIMSQLRESAAGMKKSIGGCKYASFQRFT